MAARVDDLKEDFLTCPLCLQLYTRPKVLHCQHTFCLTCLQKYIDFNKFADGRCVCPVCKVKDFLPGGDASILPNNFLVIGLLQFVDGSGSSSAQNVDPGLPAEPPGVDCPLCEERRTCTDYCVQCQLWLCAACKKSHSKVPATRDHTIRSLQDLHANSLGKLKQAEEIMNGLLEETDLQQAKISCQRQLLSEQMSETALSISATASQLQTLVGDMHQQLLSELYAKTMDADDCLSKAGEEAESRRNQLDRLRGRVKDAHSLANMGQGLRLVGNLQHELLQLTPLPSMSASAVIHKVGFHAAPHLLDNLRADTLGHVMTLSEASSADKRFPAGECRSKFEPVPGVKCNLPGFVTSIIAFGKSPERFLFVVGNKGVCSCPPRLQHAVPKFSFSEEAIFQKPWGMALTKDKRVLVSDAGSSPGQGFVAVCDLTSGKLISYLAQGLSMPRGIAVEGEVVCICDQEDRCVYVLDYARKGVIKKVVRRDADGKFLFLSPMDIAVASNGDIVVSDAGQFIKIFSSDFILKTIYQSPLPGSEFWGVYTAPEGRVYVCDWKHGIHVLSSTADVQFEGLLNGISSSDVVEITAVTFNPDSQSVLVGNSGACIYTCADLFSPRCACQ